MRQGQFTKVQRLHIESYNNAFTAVLDNGLEGKKLTEWKQKTASEILDSPQFSDLDTSEFSRKHWFEMIVRKFTNYRTQVYLKKDRGIVGTPQPPSPTGPLFKFSSLLTGRQLFAQKNSEEINFTAAQRLTATGHNNTAAIYQTVLKEMWDVLSADEKLHWDEMAEAGSGDIEKNQREFRPKMHQALTDLAQMGFIGDAELLLFYGFRKPASGELDIGIIHGHSVHNRVNFGGSRTDFQTNYGDPWGIFADTVIPRPLVTEDSVIPRNAFGVPVFPGIDLNVVTPADTRLLIAEYWAHIWAHSWAPATDYPPIPWEDLGCNPSAYYDTVKFSLPLALALPQTLNTLHTTIWAEHLVRTSSSFADTPFVFYSKERLIGVDGPLATPALIQANSDPLIAAPSPHHPETSNKEAMASPVNLLAPQPGIQINQNDLNGDQTEGNREGEGKRAVWQNFGRLCCVFIPLSSLPLQNIINNPSNTPSMHDETEETDSRAKKSGEKRPIETDDFENSSHKRAKKNNENNHRKPNDGTSSKTQASSSAPRRSSRKAPVKMSAPVAHKKTRGRRRHLGYVCSDEEGDTFDDDA
ncbi:hypothetical protein MVEN_00124000 [Mycena venus]|uniref:Uncharacterized protein n=1 Tax=Mycena venus TaxID=2733690 RepID=A0A8H7DFM9_9AGAR|nr:hypothetical protein MVEN_00124000 [Mycena venus]